MIYVLWCMLWHWASVGHSMKWAESSNSRHGMLPNESLQRLVTHRKLTVCQKQA